MDTEEGEAAVGVGGLGGDGHEDIKGTREGERRLWIEHYEKNELIG